MKFIRSSIADFESRNIIADLAMRNYYSHSIRLLGNFSKNTKLNFLTGSDLPNFKIPFKLLGRFIDISNKISTNLKQSRTIKELIYLLSFLYERKIELFLAIDIEKNGENFQGQFNNNLKFIILNVDYPLDIDSLCEVLAHELIHYLQNYKPLNFEINDSIVSHVMESYKKLDSNILRMELEAFTYQNCPNFIEHFEKRKSILRNIFYISQKRNNTINWITKNRKLPNYSNSSKPKYIIDFSRDTIDKFITALTPERIYFPNRLIKN